MMNRKIGILLLVCMNFSCVVAPLRIKTGQGALCAKINWQRTHDFDLLVIAKLRDDKPLSRLIYASNYRRRNIFCFNDLEPGTYALGYGDATYQAYFFPESLIRASTTTIDRNQIKSMGAFTVQVTHSMPLYQNEKNVSQADLGQIFYREIWQAINPASTASHIQPSYWLVKGDRSEFHIEDSLRYEFTP